MALATCASELGTYPGCVSLAHQVEAAAGLQQLWRPVHCLRRCRADTLSETWRLDTSLGCMGCWMTYQQRDRCTDNEDRDADLSMRMHLSWHMWQGRFVCSDSKPIITWRSTAIRCCRGGRRCCCCCQVRVVICMNSTRNPNGRLRKQIKINMGTVGSGDLKQQWLLKSRLPAECGHSLGCEIAHSSGSDE